MPNDFWTYLLIGIVVVGIVIAVILVLRSRARPGTGQGPERLLDPGWQFYSKPTTLEPTGTVFRIDAQGRRYLVDELKVTPQVGDEAFGMHRQSVKAKIGLLARVVGIDAKVGAEKSEQFEFELNRVSREEVSDAALRTKLQAFLRKLESEYRSDNRYFVIRACRTAFEITYLLNSNQVAELGGEAVLAEQLSLKGTAFSSTRTGEYSLQQKFDKPMRVLFLPEEIKPISAGLGTDHPKLGVVPVQEFLMWKEEGETSFAG